MPSTISVSQDISAPITKTFQLATQIPLWAEIVDDIIDVEMLTDSEIGVGTRFRETRKMFGKEATEEMEVIAFEPNSEYTLLANSCGSEYRTSITFVESDSGTDSPTTTITMTFQATPQTFFAKLMSPLCIIMGGTLRKMVAKDFACLKRYIESQDGES